MADEEWGAPVSVGSDGPEWAPPIQTAAAQQPDAPLVVTEEGRRMGPPSARITVGKEPATKPSTEWSGYPTVIGHGIAQGAVTSAGKVLSGIPEMYSDDPEQTMLGRAGKATQEWGKTTFPLTAEDEASITGQGSKVVGAVAPIVATALANPIAGIGAAVVQGATNSAADQGERARKHGALPETAQSAARWNAALGAGVNALPVGMILKPIQQAAPGFVPWATAKLGHAAKSGITFATVGEAQTYLAEQIATTFDKNAAYSFDAKRAVGALVAGGALGAAAGRVERPGVQQAARHPDEQAVLARIGEPDKPPSEFSFHRLYTKAKDDLHPIAQVETQLNPKPSGWFQRAPKISADESPYIQARLTRGSTGRAEQFIEHGTFDPHTGATTGRGLQQIIDPVRDDLDGLRAYAIARRAVELDQRGIQSGVPLQEAANTVQRGNATYGQVYNELQKYQDDVLQYVKKSGLISDDQYRLIKDANKDYVPFHRVMAGDNSPFQVGKGMTTYNPVKGIHGSDKQIIDPIETIIKNTYSFIALADRNLARQKFEDFVTSRPGGNQIMQRVPPSVRPIEVDQKELMRAMKQQGVTATPDPAGFTIFRPQAFRPAPDEFVVYRDGSRHIYKTDPYLAAAFNGMDTESVGVLTKILSVPAKTLRAGATITPEFVLKNMTRDQLSAFIFSKGGRGNIPFFDFLKGAASLSKKDEFFQDWRKSGGANATQLSIDRDYVQALIDRHKDPTWGGAIKNVIKSPIDAARAQSEFVENATRLGEFMRLRNQGKSLSEAGYSAREITLDFQRLGSKARELNRIVAFMNANLEGNDRTIRAFKDNPARSTAAAAAGITVPSYYLWQANKDDPRVAEIPRWEKDLSWIIPTDDWKNITPVQAQGIGGSRVRQLESGQWQYNNGTVWRIPKPPFLGFLFGSVPERIWDYNHQKDTKALKGAAGSVAGAIFPPFVPQAVLPVIEQHANRSLFTGRPLVPKYLEGKLPEAQEQPYSSETAIKVGEALRKIPGLSESNVTSPIVIENYVRAWTGGMGQYALSANDAVMRGIGISPSKVNPTPTAADRMVMRAFVSRYPQAGANSIVDFYEEFNRRQRVSRTVKDYAKEGKAEDAMRLRQENALVAADGIQKAMGRQLKLVRDVYRDNKNYTPEQKRELIDMSYLQMIKMAQSGLALFKSSQEAVDQRKRAQ
jgi:hypothetical protein